MVEKIAEAVGFASSFSSSAVDDMGVMADIWFAGPLPTGLATEVYANTQQGDRLRALLVDLHVWNGIYSLQSHHSLHSTTFHFTNNILPT